MVPKNESLKLAPHFQNFFNHNEFSNQHSFLPRPFPLGNDEVLNRWTTTALFLGGRPPFGRTSSFCMICPPFHGIHAGLVWSAPHFPDYTVIIFTEFKNITRICNGADYFPTLLKVYIPCNLPLGCEDQF